MPTGNCRHFSGPWFFALQLCFVGHVEDTCVSVDGTLYATIGSDKALKVFDVVNFGNCNLFAVRESTE